MAFLLDSDLSELLRELGEFGRESDERASDRTQKMLNQDLPSAIHDKASPGGIAKNAENGPSGSSKLYLR